VLCVLGGPVALGRGRRGSRKNHSASERSVSGMLFSCSVSYRASVSDPLFIQFRKRILRSWTSALRSSPKFTCQVFSEVRPVKIRTGELDSPVLSYLRFLAISGNCRCQSH
jgi:hypothetical protein